MEKTYIFIIITKIGSSTHLPSKKPEQENRVFEYSWYVPFHNSCIGSIWHTRGIISIQYGSCHHWCQVQSLPVRVELPICHWNIRTYVKVPGNFLLATLLHQPYSFRSRFTSTKPT
jgi:hypothetical protein